MLRQVFVRLKCKKHVVNGELAFYVGIKSGDITMSKAVHRSRRVQEGEAELQPKHDHNGALSVASCH